MTEQIQTDWEKEFEKFEYIGIALDWYMMNAYPENRKPGREHLEDVKQFIKGVVDQAQQQERQRVIEEVERLLVDKSYPITDPDSIDYGKMLESPINEWNAELRKKLNQLKGSE